MSKRRSRRPVDELSLMLDLSETIGSFSDIALAQRSRFLDAGVDEHLADLMSAQMVISLVKVMGGE
jgi:hypothetical protein